MDNKIDKSTPERIKNIYLFYFIILGLLLGFLIGEVLITEFILENPLTLFENMIPSSILYVLLLIVTLIYARKTQTNTYEMGFHSLYLLKSIAIGFLTTSGYLIVVMAFRMPLIYSSVLDIFIIGAFAALIGLTEESMFRGYIQANFLHEISQMKSIFFTGILFAFLHIPSYIISGAYLNIASVPSLVLIGLILGFIRIRTGNIWSVIIAHTTWNYYLFLFTPEITESTPIEIVLAVLIASLAMWGSILAAMFLAKLWIDRPEQIPDELHREYSIKIISLGKKIGELQYIISTLQRSGYPQSQKIITYSNRIKTYEEFIVILKEYLPQINKLNYKVLQKLIPLKLKLNKVQNLMLISYHPRLSNLKRKEVLLETEIHFLENELINTNNFNDKRSIKNL
ncbi:MAG: CPBP family intramembrane glutamic endopeptidase [Promethearchaeota archaeon]